MVTTMPTDRDRKKITNSAEISGWEGGTFGMPRNVSDYEEKTLEYVLKFQQAVIKYMCTNNTVGETRSTSKSYPQFKVFK